MRLWRGAWTAAVIVPVAFLAVFFLYPTLSMLWLGVWDEGVDTGHIRTVLTNSVTWKVVGQTLIQAALGTAGAILLGVPGAYVLYRIKFPLQRAARALATIPFVLPTVVVGVAFRALLGRGGPLGFLGLDETLTAVVLALVYFNYAVVVRTVGSMWQSLDPRVVQAARTLGASRTRAFWTVTLPQLAPAIASAGAIVFLFCSTSYGLIRTLGSPGYGTLETEIWRQAQAYLDVKTAAVLSILQVVIVICTLIVSEKLSKKAATRLNLRGRHVTPFTKGDIPVAALTAIVILTLITTPILTLVTRSLQVDGEWSLENYSLLATSGEGFAGGATVHEAITNSLVIGLAATGISLLIGVPLSLVLSRHVRGPLRRGQEALSGAILLPLGVSAVTVGFGFSIALDSPPLDLRNSPLLIPIAQAVVALPLVVRSLTPTLQAIAPGRREAAATLGASPWRVLATIDGPFLLRGIGVAIGFAFATSLGEFGATSFLARPDNQTLPVMIVRLLGRPGEHNYGMAMAGAVVLALLAATIMAVAEAARKDPQ